MRLGVETKQRGRAWACPPCPGRLAGSASVRSRTDRKRANLLTGLRAKEGDGEARLEAKLATVKDKVIVVDNYDSFTFNLCQVSMVFALLR